jgi:hypothetical protein
MRLTTACQMMAQWAFETTEADALGAMRFAACGK